MLLLKKFPLSLSNKDGMILAFALLFNQVDVQGFATNFILMTAILTVIL